MRAMQAPTEKRIHSHYATEDGWVYMCLTYGRDCEHIPADKYRTSEEARAQRDAGGKPWEHPCE